MLVRPKRELRKQSRKKSQRLLLSENASPLRCVERIRGLALGGTSLYPETKKATELNSESPAACHLGVCQELGGIVLGVYPLPSSFDVLV
jgi:hypothetical protein